MSEQEGLSNCHNRMNPRHTQPALHASVELRALLTMSRQEWKKSLQHHPEWKSVSGVGMLVGKSFESFKLQKQNKKQHYIT